MPYEVEQAFPTRNEGDGFEAVTLAFVTSTVTAEMRLRQAEFEQMDALV